MQEEQHHRRPPSGRCFPPTPREEELMKQFGSLGMDIPMSATLRLLRHAKGNVQVVVGLVFGFGEMPEAVAFADTLPYGVPIREDGSQGGEEEEEEEEDEFGSEEESEGELARTEEEEEEEVVVDKDVRYLPHAKAVRVLEDKLQAIRGNENEQEGFCKAVRHRLLYGDAKVAWLDGAVAMKVCMTSFRMNNAVLASCTKAQQALMTDCMCKATSIMLDQSGLLPWSENFVYAISVVDSAVGIAMEALVERNDPRFMEIFALTLDPDRALWKGNEIQAEYNERLSSIAKEIIKPVFACLRGPWCGSEIVVHALNAARFLDISHIAGPVVREKLAVLTSNEQSFKSDKHMEQLFTVLLEIAQEEERARNDVEKGERGGQIVKGGNEETSSSIVDAARAPSFRLNSRNLVVPASTDLLQSLFAQPQPVVEPISLTTSTSPSKTLEFFQFWFDHVALRLFKTANLEQRLYGLMQIEKLIEQCPPSYIGGGNGVVEKKKHLECLLPHAVLCSWLERCDFFHLLLDENRLHTEVLARSKRVVRYLVSRACMCGGGGMMQPPPPPPPPPLGYPTENVMFSLFPPSYLQKMWILSSNQHESVTQVLLELICEAMEEATNLPHVVQFLEFISTRTMGDNPNAAQEGRVVIQLIYVLRKKNAILILQTNQDRTHAALNMLWCVIQVLMEDGHVEYACDLFVWLLQCEYGKPHRANFLSRCVESIQSHLVKDQDPHRSMSALRRVFDVSQTPTAALAAAGMATTTTTTTTLEADSIFEEVSCENVLQVLIAELTRFAARPLVKSTQLVFRLDLIMRFWRISAPGYWCFGFNQLKQITGVLLNDDEFDEPKFNFLFNVLKSNKLTFLDCCATFSEMVCPDLKRLCAVENPENVLNYEQRILACWKCYAEYLECIKIHDQTQVMAEAENMEIVVSDGNQLSSSSLRLGHDCLWDAALAPFVPSSVCDAASKMSIDQTNHVNDVLGKILDRLQTCHAHLRANANDSAWQGSVTRCLNMLTHFASTTKYVTLKEPLAHGPIWNAAPFLNDSVVQIKLSIAVNPIAASYGNSKKSSFNMIGSSTTNSLPPAFLIAINPLMSLRDLLLISREKMGWGGEDDDSTLLILGSDISSKGYSWYSHVYQVLTNPQIINPQQQQGINAIFAAQTNGMLPSATDLSALHVTVFSLVRTLESNNHRDASDALESARLTLSKSDTLFDLLHQLQSNVRLCDAAKAQLNFLLNLLPTRQSLIARFAEETYPEFWQSLFSSPNHSCNVYCMESVSACLCPVDPFAQAASVSFRARFASLGGLEAAIDFFLQSASGTMVLGPHEAALDGMGIHASLSCLKYLAEEIAERPGAMLECLNGLSATIHCLNLDKSEKPLTKSTSIRTLELVLAHCILVCPVMVQHCPVEDNVLLGGVQELIRVLIKSLRSHANHYIRSHACRVLICIAHMPQMSQMVWKSLLMGMQRTDRGDSYRTLTEVWKSKSPHENDVSDVKLLVNEVLEFSKTIVNETKIGNPTIAATTESDLVLMLNLAFVFLDTSNVNRTISVADIAFPEQTLEWILNSLVFSRLGAQIKPILASATALVNIFCTAPIVYKGKNVTASDESMRIVANRCRAVFLEKLRSTLSTTCKISDWSVDPEQVSRPSDLDFVGLVNQGATCYMNSLLQQFYHSPALKSWIMSLPLPVESAEPIDLSNLDDTSDNRSFSPAPGGGVISPASTKRMQSINVLRQVRRVFRFLGSSTRRSMDPKDLVDACTTLSLSNPVYQQNDARDLCDKLVDRIEVALLRDGEENSIKSCFGGRVVHLNIKRGCPHPSTEQVEDFIALELQIKGKSDLESSLRDFCAGEVLDGENRVQCDECNVKYPALLRDCLSDNLPNVLVLHLKRFQLDYDTFETVKINDRLAFPMNLNMAPFTREGLVRAEFASQQPLNPIMYKLCGVLVHRGAAGGGHYYSFIMDRQSQKWFKFNDDRVSPFDENCIPEMCYGGGFENNAESDASAYMLFYEKAKPSSTINDVGLDESILSSVRAQAVDQEIDLDNETLAKQLILNSEELYTTMHTILDTAPFSSIPLNGPKRDEFESLMDLFKASCELMFEWSVHLNKADLIEMWNETILGWITRFPDSTAPIVLDMALSCAKEILTKCRIAPIRKAFLQVVSSAICTSTNMHKKIPDFLVLVMDVIMDSSRGWRLILEILSFLRDCAHSSIWVKTLLRGSSNDAASMGYSHPLHGLARLLHFALGNLDSPFLQNASNDEAVMLLDDVADAAVENMQVIPKFPSLSWTWEERVLKWNANNAATNMLPGLMLNPGGGTAIYQIFDVLCELLNLLICPLKTLPVYFEALLGGAIGPFYNRMVRVGYSPGQLKDWLVELAAMDAPIKDRKNSNSQRIIQDVLLALVNKPLALVVDQEIETARYNSCTSLLRDLMSIEDEMQVVRISMALNPKGDVMSTFQEGLLSCTSNAMRKYWGPTTFCANSDAVNAMNVLAAAAVAGSSATMQIPLFSSPLNSMMKLTGGHFSINATYSNSLSGDKHTFRTPIFEQAHLERHFRFLYGLVNDVPLFARCLAQVASLQRRNVAHGDDELTRLVYFMSSHLMERIGGGGFNGFPQRNLVRIRSVETDKMLKVMAPIAGIDPLYVSGLRLTSQDSLLTDSENRYELGAHHLIDDKTLYACANAFILDYPVIMPGEIIEVQIRMCIKFVTTNKHADDDFQCIVVGPREGDSKIRIFERGSDISPIVYKVFDRVQVRQREVNAAREHLKPLAMTTPTISTPNGSKLNDDVAMMSEEDEGFLNEDAPDAVVSPLIDLTGIITVVTTVVAPSTKVSSKRVAIVEKTPPMAISSKRHAGDNDYVQGVIVKIVELLADDEEVISFPAKGDQKRKRILVVRLDTNGDDLSSAYDQLVELDQAPTNDAMVLSFSENLVVPSSDPLSTMDHPFTIVRVSNIPPFDSMNATVLHRLPLSVPLFPGERVGLARSSQLGIAWTAPLDFDHYAFPSWFSSTRIPSSANSILSTSLGYESNARPAFKFIVQNLG